MLPPYLSFYAVQLFCCRTARSVFLSSISRISKRQNIGTQDLWVGSICVSTWCTLLLHLTFDCVVFQLQYMRWRSTAISKLQPRSPKPLLVETVCMPSDISFNAILVGLWGDFYLLIFGRLLSYPRIDGKSCSRWWRGLFLALVAQCNLHKRGSLLQQSCQLYIDGHFCILWSNLLSTLTMTVFFKLLILNLLFYLALVPPGSFADPANGAQ